MTTIYAQIKCTSEKKIFFHIYIYGPALSSAKRQIPLALEQALGKGQVKWTVQAEFAVTILVFLQRVSSL